jgi:serine/threonine protein kinase/alpha-tubulin suppressor-like RCC1 family protein
MSEEAVPALLRLAADYEILRELGRGGTAVVYLARERETGDEVAIKLIHAKYVEDEEALARFAREARFVAQLDHPNVVPVREVLDLGRSGVALVMAHVEGRTLKQRIQQDGALSPEQAESVMRDVARALGAAHALGIVHRDVKPENIFIEPSGRALLADFGVARSMSSDTQQLTMAGVAIGTPTYMAPEQIDGRELDGRGDIYSLGLVTWEMLVGRRPWDGEALYSVLYHQKHARLPDVRELRDDVPDRLADAILGCIEKERESRWADVGELLAALDGAPPARQRPSTPLAAPASAETIRFSRPAVAASPPMALSSLPAVSPAVVPPAIAPELDETVFDPALFASELDPESRSRSRRLGPAIALAALLALTLLGTGVRALSGRRSASPRATVATSTARPAAEPPLPASRQAVGGTSSVDNAGTSASGDNAGASGVTSASGEIGSVVGAAADTTARATDSPRSVTVGAARGAARPAPDAAPPRAGAKPPVDAVPTPPPVSASRVRIVAGGRHTCLLAVDGRTFCWGGNDHGQLGTGTTARLVTPTPVASNIHFSAIAPGLSHSCGLARDGAAWCWGENEHGQLGDRSNASRGAPVRVTGGHTFTAIAAGASHSCALERDGSAWCWGANGSGQLGDGGTTDRVAPVRVAGDRHFVSIDAGWNFTCGLEAGGEAVCWGENGAGQLGDGGTSDRSTPAPVRGRIVFTALSAGNAHACGITERGQAYCWGSNTGGQLGDGTTSSRAIPGRVVGGGHFVSIAAGAVHSCGITEDGEAYCWGRNTYGQLGDGGVEDHATPTRVSGGHTFASVRAFGSHTCGATASGEAFCWGYNLDGQLGDGTRTHRTRPVYVERPSGG